MAFSGKRLREESKSHLHNSNWCQQNMKCMKGSGGSGDQRLSHPPSKSPILFHRLRNNNKRHRLRNVPLESVEKSGVEEIKELRKKIMSDLKTEGDKILRSMFKDQDEEEQKIEEIKEKEKPWNLRKKKEQFSGEIKEKEISQEKRWNLRKNKEQLSGETKLVVQLTKKEIEGDFMAMLGHGPPRRPKKRPRNVQKQLENSFPGLNLTDVTLKAYKIPN